MKMNLQKKILLLIFTFSFLPIALIHAENTYIDIIVKDTIPLIFDKEDLTDDITIDDSLIFSQWDTSNIHSYSFDLKKLCDTVLMLSDDSPYCGYVHPFQGELSSDFGHRKPRFHYGVDIKLETGDSVLCAFKGKIRIAKRSKTYGNVIVVRHNNGLETIYAHLSKINVEIGQEVEAGELLGLGGNTGRSSGSHLHFEVRFKGKAINPNEIISFKENKLKVDSYLIGQKNFQYLTTIKKERFHTVKKGETLSHIAAKYGTTVNKICKLNRLKSTTVLRVGKKIRYS